MKINSHNEWDKLKEIIEDKINLGFSLCEQQELIKLVNLSKLNAKENFSLILKQLLGNEYIGKIWTIFKIIQSHTNRTYGQHR